MRIFGLIAAVSLAAMAVPAHAVSTITDTDSVTLDPTDTQPFDFNVYFDGHGLFSNGATGQATFTFLGASANKKTYNFAYTLTNTSTAPSDNSRLVSIGFDVSGAVFALQTGAGDSFAGKKNAGIFDDLQVRDVCLYSGNNCLIAGSNGLRVGSEASGAFSLTYALRQDRLVLDNFSARWADAARRGATAGPGVIAAVPEASSWAMLLIGMAGVGASVRRRKGRAAIAHTPAD